MPSSPEARNSAKRLEIRVVLEDAAAMVCGKRLEQTGVSVHVLVAAAGEIEDDEVVLAHAREAFDETCDGVGGFERRDDALGAGEQARGVERSGVRDGGVFGAALIGEPSMFGADGRIIESRGNGVSGGDLAVFRLQDVGVGALQNAGARACETLRGGETRGVFAESRAAATGFDADHFHLRVAQKFVKEYDGVGTAADASEKMRREAPPHP